MTIKLVTLIWVVFAVMGVLRTVDSKVVKPYKQDRKYISPSLVNRSLERLFKALEKVLVFYKRQYKNLIIDGVYGLRVLEGVVKVILQEATKGKIKLSKGTKERVSKLGLTASRIAKKSLPYLKIQDPEYFKIMGFTVAERWDNIKPLKNLNLDNFVFPTSEKQKQIDMDEEEQDSCFNSLTGNKKQGLKPCTVTNKCWKVNTLLQQKGYQLTHQILYFLLGQVKGCAKVFESRFKADSFAGGTEKFLSVSCHTMYPEMQKQEELAIKTKDLGEIDLYMEQAVVCGMIGYSEYFTIEKLDRILGWRHKDGCFGFTDEISGREEENAQSHDEVEGIDKGKETMRKLKVTKDLSGGCEVHSTGVGTGLFALYLRWLLHVSSRQTTSGDAAAMFYPIPFNNLTSIVLLVIISFLILMIFSKKMGLHFHRNKCVRHCIPCI